jgi:hypothetical protein
MPNAEDMYDAYADCLKLNHGSRNPVKRARARRARACMDALAPSIPPRPATRVRQVILPSGRTVERLK